MLRSSVPPTAHSGRSVQPAAPTSLREAGRSTADRPFRRLWLRSSQSGRPTYATTPHLRRRSGLCSNVISKFANSLKTSPAVPGERRLWRRIRGCRSNPHHPTDVALPIVLPAPPTPPTPRPSADSSPSPCPAHFPPSSPIPPPESTAQARSNSSTA